LPPLAWQDVDHWRGCRDDASVNIDAVVDDNYKDDGGDGNDGDGGRDLALALAQPTQGPAPQMHWGTVQTESPQTTSWGGCH
jgi:hypothetical protein